MYDYDYQQMINRSKIGKRKKRGNLTKSFQIAKKKPNFSAEAKPTEISKHESVDFSNNLSFDKKPVTVEIELLRFVVFSIGVTNPLNGQNLPEFLKTTTCEK